MLLPEKKVELKNLEKNFVNKKIFVKNHGKSHKLRMKRAERKNK